MKMNTTIEIAKEVKRRAVCFHRKWLNDVKETAKRTEQPSDQIMLAAVKVLKDAVERISPEELARIADEENHTIEKAG